MSLDPPGATGGHDSRSHRTVRRALWMARDAWTIAGLAIALLVALELAYRAQGAMRRGSRPEGRSPGVPAAPPSPPSWYSEWQREQREAVNRTRWDPYRGWWPRPYASRYVNIDSLGRRVTPQAPPTGSPRRVLLLGGSTMWGFTARDSLTIPALVAQALRRRGVTDVEIVNLAQPAFTSTQADVTLLIALRDGERLAATIFLDGSNDVATAYQSGRAGAVFNERLAIDRWARGGRTLGDGLLGLTRHFTLLSRLAGRGADTVSPPDVAARERLCAGVAGHYLEGARSIQAIGRDRGFVTLFLWQPLLATTHKAATPPEDSIADFPGFREMLQRCTALVDRVAPTRLGADFRQMASVFDAEHDTIFLDDAGHVTEQANGILADRIVGILLERLAP